MGLSWGHVWAYYVLPYRTSYEPFFLSRQKKTFRQKKAKQAESANWAEKVEKQAKIAKKVEKRGEITEKKSRRPSAAY